MIDTAPEWAKRANAQVNALRAHASALLAAEVAKSPKDKYGVGQISPASMAEINRLYELANYLCANLSRKYRDNTYIVPDLYRLIAEGYTRRAGIFIYFPADSHNRQNLHRKEVAALFDALVWSALNA